VARSSGCRPLGEKERLSRFPLFPLDPADDPHLVRAALASEDQELARVRGVTVGFTNREVAERLYVSPNTVSSHLRRAFEKLGINSRVALARMAAEHAEPA
jgi:DNA-binding NarL/FixJ family response regulator